MFERILTVGDLKKKISNIPDNVEIVFDVEKFIAGDFKDSTETAEFKSVFARKSMVKITLSIGEY